MQTKFEVIEYIKNQQLTETLAEEIYKEVFEFESLDSTIGITEIQLSSLNELIESFTGVPVEKPKLSSGSSITPLPEPEKLEISEEVNQQTELETAAKGSIRGAQLMKLYQEFTVKGMVAQTHIVEQNIKNAFELLTSSQLDNVRELLGDRDLINKIVKLSLDDNIIKPPEKSKEVALNDVNDLLSQQVNLNSKKVNKESFLKNFNVK